MLEKKLSRLRKITQLLCMIAGLFTVTMSSTFAVNHLQKTHRKTKVKTHFTHSTKKSNIVHQHHPQLNSHRQITRHKRIGQTDQINAHNIAYSNLPLYVLSSMEQRLVNFVRKTVSSLHYSSYKLGGTTIDASRGIYVVDCSTYVDHILKTVYPLAYSSLVNGTGTEKPTTDDYYDYFVNLDDKTKKYWNMIDDVENLRPGDILVFRFKNAYGRETGGHVMVVMDQPSQSGDTFFVRVADSAPTGHSADTRLPRRSGIGIGTLMLKVNNKTYQPYAYAWKAGAHWERNVNFAMARPTNDYAKG